MGGSSLVGKLPYWVYQDSYLNKIEIQVEGPHSVKIWFNGKFSGVFQAKLISGKVCWAFCDEKDMEVDLSIFNVNGKNYRVNLDEREVGMSTFEMGVTVTVNGSAYSYTHSYF